MPNASCLGSVRGIYREPDTASYRDCHNSFEQIDVTQRTIDINSDSLSVPLSVNTMCGISSILDLQV